MQLERYNRNLFSDLEREKKAIQNWQRIKVLIAILKLCGNRMEKFETVVQKEKKRTETCDDFMVVLVKSPNTILMRAWSVFTSLFYMIGFFIDSILISYRIYPILITGQKLFTTFRAIIMLADIVVTFFTAIPKEIHIPVNDRQDNP